MVVHRKFDDVVLSRVRHKSGAVRQVQSQSVWVSEVGAYHSDPGAVQVGPVHLAVLLARVAGVQPIHMLLSQIQCDASRILEVFLTNCVRVIFDLFCGPIQVHSVNIAISVSNSLGIREVGVSLSWSEVQGEPLG